MARLVYSLRFETEREPGEPIIEFIVPLDRAGNGLGSLVPIGKPRVVDLRPGDSFLYRPSETQYNSRRWPAVSSSAC